MDHDSERPRKHRATGKPRGGRRDGAGRASGSLNALGYGEVKAIKSTRLRLPESASPEEEHLAGRALQRLVDVMEERVSSFQSRAVLSAATRLREEICGPLAQKHEVAGKDGEALSIHIDLGASEP